MERNQNKKSHFFVLITTTLEKFFANFFLKKLLQTSARFVAISNESGDSLLNKIMKIIAYEVCNI